MIQSKDKQETNVEINNMLLLNRLRRGFSADDHFTNVGLVVSPTLERLHEDQTSIRLSVHSDYTNKPVTFTCDGKNLLFA